MWNKGIKDIAPFFLNVSYRLFGYMVVGVINIFAILCFIRSKKITEDLNYPVKIITCPTIREKSGLALSSRNAYLSKEELNKALSISDSLKKAKELIENKKIKPVKNIVLEIKKIIKPVTDKIDYIEIRDAETLVEIKDNIDRKVVIAIAAYVGKTRLIDNIVVKPR